MRNDRAELRGKRLESFCKKAQITTNECGPHDDRKYCYGLVSQQTDELIEECKNCKANIIYADCGGKKE